jgi:hypothetical protein
VSPALRFAIATMIFVVGLGVLAVFAKPDLAGFLLGGAVFLILVATIDRVLLTGRTRRPTVE